MKNLARLALFFSLSFILSFILAMGARYLYLWLEAAQAIPARPAGGFLVWIAAAQVALPAAVYVSLLFTLSYTVRRDMGRPLSIIVLFILGCLAAGGAAMGISQLEIPANSPAGERPATLGSPGLMLVQGDTVIVLLDTPENPRGSRVVSIPGRPLIYQAEPLGPNNRILALPRAAFRGEGPYFMTGLFLDLSLTAGQLETRLREGLSSFGMYLGGLCLLLVSLRFILELTAWPLANLFLSALAFRGILAFETLLDSAEIQTLIGGFLGSRIPAGWISPLVFISLGILILLYTILVSIARGRRSKHGEA
ncbi:MAG: hypothetical protein LBT39_06200 [Treponema sp.]|nr:hypothetical protein [Treponema sp.]